MDKINTCPKHGEFIGNYCGCGHEAKSPTPTRDELLPCPFCSEPAEIINSQHCAETFIECTKCNGSVCELGRDEAIKAWNTRATPAGWQLVPVEPTPKMIKPIQVNVHNISNYGTSSLSAPEMEKVYKAMLSAAPLPPRRDEE